MKINLRNLVIVIAALSAITTVSACQVSGRDPAEAKRMIEKRKADQQANKNKETLGYTLLGSELTASIGSFLDRSDIIHYNNTSQQSLEVSQAGITSTWKNPGTGNYGTITPVRTFQPTPGQYCREYSQTIVTKQKTAQGMATACRQDNGTWKLLR